MRLTVQYFWHCCRLPFLGNVIPKDWAHGVGHSPVCQILLQIVVRAVITPSLSLLEVFEDVVDVLLVLEIFLREDL